jgi:hypothetical protein
VITYNHRSTCAGDTVIKATKQQSTNRTHVVMQNDLQTHLTTNSRWTALTTS